MPKIAIIDDDKSLLGLAGDFLRSQGWTVACAGDGAAGIRLVKEAKPDLVLLDVNLPDMDGFAVCSAIRADPALSALPVVLISGDRKKAEDILKGLKGTGADGYLLKPIHLAVLQAKLDAVLRSLRGGPAA